MKLVTQFNNFLSNTVNLNNTRLCLLDDSTEAIKRFIKASEWKPKVILFDQQGSWAHKTIIKPVSGGMYDADLIIRILKVDGWRAGEYLRTLRAIFEESATYKGKTTLYSHCVTINYAGERKIDLAPCVIDRNFWPEDEVCNRLDDAFEKTAYTDYTDWIILQNSYSGSNSFRKVTRLLKYLRDIKTTFTCPSVLLTTLLGNQISAYDQNSSDFSDTPTALKTIMGRLDDTLQANSTKPYIANPKLPSEDLGELLDDAQYANFRSFVHKYRGWIDEAFGKEDRSESIKAWQKVFGDEFAKSTTVLAEDVAMSVGSSVRSLLVSSAAHLDELVDAVKRLGISVLPREFNRPPHLQEPIWPKAPSQLFTVAVLATFQNSKFDATGQPIRSGQTLPAQGGLWLEAAVNGSLPIPQGFNVKWRITNTGMVAVQRRQGRGGFYSPDSGTRRWESLSFRGVHMAEVFVLRNLDSQIVASSLPFYVVIE